MHFSGKALTQLVLALCFGYLDPNLPLELRKHPGGKLQIVVVSGPDVHFI